MSNPRSPSPHLRRGWVVILAFATLGFALEVLHGFKIGWYLDVATETRRSMFTLAHAHGTLLGLLHVAFAVTVERCDEARGLGTAGRLLDAATILLPTGFLLGGIWIHGGDPGAGIVLVPIGAITLIGSIVLTLRACRTSSS